MTCLPFGATLQPDQSDPADIAHPVGNREFARPLHE